MGQSKLIFLSIYCLATSFKGSMFIIVFSVRIIATKIRCYLSKKKKKKDHLCPVFKYFSMTKGIKAWLHEAIS